MSTYNVIRSENRANGREEFVGTVSADTTEQAQMEAEGQFSCDELHHLFVIEVASELDTTTQRIGIA